MKNSAAAPGAPGEKPHWAKAAKVGVGTALNAVSDIWFTLADGIVTELFHPFVDMVCTRQLELLVTNRQDFYSEEARDTDSVVKYLGDGVPAFDVVNMCQAGRYRLEKTILTDPHRPTLLQHVRFIPLQGELSAYSLFASLGPHLANQGADNTAWVDDYKGVPMLFAERSGVTLALACSAPWLNRTAGFVGMSDGRHDLGEHKQLTACYDRAENGNVGLMGEVELEACGGSFLLTLGFGRDQGEAGFRVRASLFQGFDTARTEYVRLWADWQKTLLPLSGSQKHPQNLYRISAAVMRTHESKHFPGGMIASLATPWGASQGDDDMGYHLVWPRDMIETVGGLLAIQKHDDARRVLTYFQATQDADGHWPQNMRTNGMPYWDGIQLDETAFVILLVDLARRNDALEKKRLDSLWPMVRKAAGYLVSHGPLTPLDRWEEEAGYFPSTIAVEIPALLAAANFADQQDEPNIAAYLRETADAWNAVIDQLLYVTDTDLARRAGVDGYYTRFAKPDQLQAAFPAAGEITLKNHADGEGRHAVAEIVSPDALMLVRFGLRAADDPRIVNTVRVIDQELKVETPFGPCWHRYTDDGYGEHADGSPFDGNGIGRAWPLLTGERAHYELAAGRVAEAERLLQTMERFANDSGLISEQIWDSPDLPDRGLHLGRPSGSAMPLVWAHAEYVKLRRSLHEGRVFDMPPEAVERYIVQKTDSSIAIWRFDQQRRSMPRGKTLRIELLAPATVHWSSYGWKTTQDVRTRDSGLEVHYVDLPTDDLAPGTPVVFTFYWLDVEQWEGRNFEVTIGDQSAGDEPSQAGVRPATDEQQRDTANAATAGA